MGELEETLALPSPEEDEVVDTEDGGAIVRFADEADAPGNSEHFANLADHTPNHELKRLGTQLLEMIDKDKQARSKRDEQYEEGIRRTGLGDDAPGGAQFQGASKVVHPMLTEACIDFAARAMKEIFPPTGPVKDSIQGRSTEAKIAKAKRKTTLLNWQLTVQCQEVRAELEQMMTQVPLGGAQYLKLNWNKAKNRPTFLFVAIDDMYLPFAATNFYSSQRKTHVQFLTRLDYEERVKSGMYRDVDLPGTGQEPDQSRSGTASDKIEGREQTSYNEDGLRTVFECHVTMDIAFDEKTEGYAPYIVTIDKTTGEVLGLYRNWEEKDRAREELQWFVEWPFIPWRGAYPIGLPHMIGGLAAASTGALRALMDSAHINNTASMVKLKGSIGGQNTSVQPTEIVELEGSFNVDDIRKLAMPMPFNPPSAVLFQLLGFLIDAGKGVVRTSLEDAVEGNASQPVGTTLAKIEQGMVVFSSIHMRLHDSTARFLRILHRLNGMNLDERMLKEDAGEVLATRADFQGPLDVVPVSDPNIFSETQRFAQVQAVAQRATEKPELYNARKVEERLLETLKIPNAKELLAPPTEPKEQNAVNENAAASLGRPITAFPEQDHVAHLTTHVAYMMSPMFGSNKLLAARYLPAILGHIAEHLTLWYAAAVFDACSEALGKDLGDIMRDMGDDAEERKTLDKLLAEASLFVVQEGTEMFQSLPPIVQQAEALLQSMQPPQQDNPLVGIEMQKLQQKGQTDQQRLQIQQAGVQQKAQTDAQRLAMEQQDRQQQGALEQQRMAMASQDKAQDRAAAQQSEQQRIALEGQDRQLDEADSQRSLAVKTQSERQRAMEAEADREQQAASDEADRQLKLTMNREDNETALEIADVEAATGKEIAVSTGTGINPGS